MRYVEPHEVRLLHDICVARYGGLIGSHNTARIVAVVERVKNQTAYEAVSDVFELAAMYCVAIARRHVFNDSNKRTAINTAYLFLKRNGIQTHTIEGLEHIVVSVASGEIAQNKLAELFRNVFTGKGNQ